MGRHGRGTLRRDAPTLAFLLAVAAGYVVVLAANWPGHATVDTILQLHEGRLGLRETWGPELFARLLGIFDRLRPGTSLYVAATSLLLFAALASLAALQRVGWLAAPAAALVLLTPQVLIYQGIAWKDVLFANLAVTGYVVLAHAGRRWEHPPSRLALLALAAVLMGASVLVRQNGLAILLPAALAVGWMARTRGMLASAGMLAASLGAAFTIGHFAELPRSAPPKHPDVGLRILEHYDLVGIAARTPGLELPRLEAERPDADDAVRALAGVYSPERVDTLNERPELKTLWRLPSGTVRLAWLAAVRDHPLAYLQHRADAFRWVFLTPKLEACLPVATGLAGPPQVLADLELAPRMSSRDQTLASYASAWFRTPLFSHLAFALTSLALMAALAFRGDRADVAILALQAAGLLFAASFLPISLACDYRYLYALDLGSLVGLLYFTLDPRLGRSRR